MGNQLAQRVADKRSGKTGNGSSGEDLSPQEKQIRELGGTIRTMEQQFQMAMPRGVEAAQLIRDALTCIRQTPDLAKCDYASVLGALMTCAQLGLRPGVGALGHAWLLPFSVWDKETQSKQLRAQLIIGYQGYAELAYRSGRVASLVARTVYAADTFDVDFGLSDNLIHKPALSGSRGDAVAYYAICKTTTGGHAFEVLSRADAEAHRDKFAMAKSKVWENGTWTGDMKVVGPWRDHFDAMAQKTSVRRLFRWMPKSTELAMALAIDEGVRVDLTPDVSPDEVTEFVQPPAEIEGASGPVAIEKGKPAPVEVDWPQVAEPGSGARVPEGGH